MSNICDCCGLVPDDMRFADTHVGRLRICRVCFRTPISVLETVRKLKSALAAITCHVGGGAVADCSVGFLCHVPEEVKAIVDAMKQQIADLTRRLAEAEADALYFANMVDSIYMGEVSSRCKDVDFRKRADKYQAKPSPTNEKDMDHG